MITKLIHTRLEPAGEYRHPNPQPNSGVRRQRNRGVGKHILLLAAGTVAVVLLAGCGGTTVAPPAPDMVPVGDGLKVIGFAVVGAAVVAVLGRLLK